MTTALERKAGRVNRFIDTAKKKLKPAPTKPKPVAKKKNKAPAKKKKA